MAWLSASAVETIQIVGIAFVAGIGAYGLISLSLWALRKALSAFGMGQCGASLKRSQTAVAGSIVTVIGLVFTGVYVPYRISDESKVEATRASCFSAVLSLRETLTTVQLGYVVAPLQRDQRRHDWAMLETELQNAEFGCRFHSFADSKLTSEMQHLSEGVATARANSQAREPDTEFLERLERWCDNASEDLQSR
ncbi:hypothetical protein [Mycobacterium sp. C31M]